jgi:hypothetical protein
VSESDDGRRKMEDGRRKMDEGRWMKVANNKI